MLINFYYNLVLVSSTNSDIILPKDSIIKVTGNFPNEFTPGEPNDYITNYYFFGFYMTKIDEKLKVKHWSSKNLYKEYILGYEKYLEMIIPAENADEIVGLKSIFVAMIENEEESTLISFCAQWKDGLFTETKVKTKTMKVLDVQYELDKNLICNIELIDNIA